MVKLIVRAAEPDEYPEIYAMVDKAFKPSTIEHTIIDITTRKDHNFQRGDLRVVEADGKIVSMMMLIRRPLRIGTAIVNGALVAPVATHPDFQRKGYCSAVMRDAVRYMETQRFDITILWGIPWLYPRYGYSPAMVKTEIAIRPTQNSAPEKNPCKCRTFTETDLEPMTQIYHNNTATRTGAEIRTPEMWEWTPGGHDAKLKVFTDEKDGVIGYCALGTDWTSRPCAHEIGVSNDTACEAVFNSLVETCREKELTEFPCVMHPDHPFARFAFWRGGEIRIRSGGGAGMARVIDLVSLVTKMEKAFERRLHHSEFHNLEYALKISCEEKLIVLHVNGGQVSVSTDRVKGDDHLDIPLVSLNPLITGYKGIKELVKNPQIRVKGGKQVVRLIEVLFPPGFPFGGLPPLVWE